MSKDANFESFTTFYIPDSVLVIGSKRETSSSGQPIEADDIITTLVNNMESRGFKRTLDKDNCRLRSASFLRDKVLNYFADYNDGYNYPYWWWNYPGYLVVRVTGVTGLAHEMDGITRIL